MPLRWMKCSALWHVTQREETDMGIFLSFVKKESLHVIRDRRTMVITLLIPVALLLLFGFAISTEVNEVRLAAVVEKHNETTQQILERFSQNNYFDFQGLTAATEAERLLRSGKSDVVLFLRENEGEVQAQIMVDASNTTSAQAMTAYTQGVLNELQPGKAPVLTHTLYNPRMKSAYNFVPGIMGMIFILICAIMTSVSIVREKEDGTLNLLLVSPIRPGTIILGKLVPYLILSCLILALMLLIAYTLLSLPLSSSLVNVVLLSLLYIVLSLSIGLLVSTIVKTQLTALIVSAVLFMIPVIMLSGMIFPIENMPAILQWISCIIPARWYVAAMRKLMIQQLGIEFVMTEIVVLGIMTVGLLIFSIRKFYSTSR